MFRCIFNSLARSRYLSLFSHSFSFILWSAGTAKSIILQIFFFFCCWLLSSLVFWSRLGDPFVCQSPIGVCVRHFVGYVLGCAYTICWSKLNFLHIFLWITLPTHLCLAFYSFCTNLLHSLIMWLMVSSPSPHSLHLLFCCVLSILALIWLVLMAPFCAAIRRFSVSLLKFPFLSHVQALSSEMLFISHLKHPWSCFSSHFCFLVVVILLSIVLSVLFLMAVISPLSCFSM